MFYNISDMKKQNKFIPSDKGSEQSTPLLSSFRSKLNSGSLQASEDDLAGMYQTTSNLLQK